MLRPIIASALAFALLALALPAAASPFGPPPPALTLTADPGPYAVGVAIGVTAQTTPATGGTLHWLIVGPGYRFDTGSHMNGTTGIATIAFTPTTSGTYSIRGRIAGAETTITVVVAP